MSADDFGLSTGVNRGIEEAFLAGGLSTTSVMAAEAAAAEVTDVARRHPDLDIGLHVNLTHGSPVLDPARVPTLVDGDGLLVPFGELRSRLLHRRVSAEQVRAEVAAQFTRLRSFGVEPTHWDSHQHVAFLPGLVGPVFSAAHAAGLRRARCPRVWIASSGGDTRFTRMRWRIARPRRFAGDAYLALVAARIRRSFRTPAWQVAPELVVGAAQDPESRWRAMLDSLPDGMIEAVTHPGHLDGHLEGISERFVEARSNDLAALTRLGTTGIRLGRFRDLDRY